MITEKRKLNYANMEPALKKQHLSRKEAQHMREEKLSRLRSNCRTWYNSMNATEKQNRLSDMRNSSQAWYDSIDTTEKQDRLSNMCINSQTWYNSMNATNNQTVYQTCAIAVKHGTIGMNDTQKQNRLSDMRNSSQAWYNCMDDTAYQQIKLGTTPWILQEKKNIYQTYLLADKICITLKRTNSMIWITA